MDPSHQESQTPPILQGDFVVEARAPAWPMALGVISIIFGGLGGLVNLWGIVAPLFADALASMMPQDPTTQASLAVQKDLAPYSMGASALNFIGSAMLLVGGIGLCLRARWGIAAIKLWIPWRMLTAILSAVVGYIGMQASLKAMASQPGSAGMASLGGAFGVIFIALGLLWWWAYPVFMVIWLSRRKVRKDVKAWA